MHKRRPLATFAVKMKIISKWNKEVSIFARENENKDAEFSCVSKHESK